MGWTEEDEREYERERLESIANRKAFVPGDVVEWEFYVDGLEPGEGAVMVISVDPEREIYSGDHWDDHFVLTEDRIFWAREPNYLKPLK